MVDMPLAFLTQAVECLDEYEQVGRLVFADWLEERGDPRAWPVRMQSVGLILWIGKQKRMKKIEIIPDGGGDTPTVMTLKRSGDDVARTLIHPGMSWAYSLSLLCDVGSSVEVVYERPVIAGWCTTVWFDDGSYWRLSLNQAGVRLAHVDYISRLFPDTPNPEPIDPGWAQRKWHYPHLLASKHLPPIDYA